MNLETRSVPGAFVIARSPPADDGVQAAFGAPTMHLRLPGGGGATVDLAPLLTPVELDQKPVARSWCFVAAPLDVDLLDDAARASALGSGRAAHPRARPPRAVPASSSKAPRASGRCAAGRTGRWPGPRRQGPRPGGTGAGFCAREPRVSALWNAHRPWFAVLALFLALGLAARLHAALTDLGVYWPDEVYQSLEPAHRLVFGTALLPWEFVVGARNWLLPGLIAGVFALSSALGVRDGQQLLLVVRVLFALTSFGTVLGVLRLGRALDLAWPATVAGAAALSAMSLDVYFAPRALGEVAAALPVTWGLGLLLHRGRRWHVVAGASLLGLAVLLRIHCGLFAVSALVGLALAGRRRDALVAFGVLCGWALAYGVLDLVTWGRFLHSAQLYLRFNVLEGRAADWGVQPPAFYTKHLVSSLGALWVVLATVSVVGLRRAAFVAVPAALFLGAHIALPHKELRFIIPILPLVCVAAAAGLDVLGRLRPALGVCGAALLLGLGARSLASHRDLTFAQVGRLSETGSAWDSGGPVTRLLFLAGRQARLCGVGLVGWSRHTTFASTALHRDVPFYEEPLPAADLGFYDVVIAPAGRQPGTVLGRVEGFELVRLPDRPCAKDPAYEPYLDERTARLAKDPSAL